MTWRVLKGQRLNGTYGFDVSKPGFDVTVANILQMAFSSDYRLPNMVAKGTFVSTPTSGPAPGSNIIDGAVPTANTVSYGRSITPYPFVLAIASAPDWTLPLTSSVAQLGYLNNRFHTEIMETCGAGRTSYGGVTVQKDNGSVTPTERILPTWASCRFTFATFNDRAVFSTNCRNNVTIKYLILENK